MATHFPFRFLSLFLLVSFALCGSVRAMEDPNMEPPKPVKPPTYMKRPLGPTEYKRVDPSAYPKSELLVLRPDAVIIPQGKYEVRDGAYYFMPKVRAPKELFFETTSDWVEPITPPDMPASLGVPPDQMQIREPQGDVEVALPSAPANFTPATANMTVPNGAVIKTGDNSTAAVLFGGVDSARLMPDSAAAVQQTVTPESRSAEVDLTTGGVFSKVGTQLGVAGTYAVHTPFGNASAQGGDFVTITTGSRTDVWVAAGRVRLDDANDTKVGELTSDGTGELRLLRAPAIADAKDALAADAQTLTAALNFIPLADQKLKVLRDKAAQGQALTANEDAYLKRIRQVPYLMMLELVPQAAPAPATPASPVAAAPSTPPPVAPPKPALPLKPMTIFVHHDGTVKFHGLNMDVAHLQSTLQKISQTRPLQPFIVHAGSDVSPDQVQAVQAALSAANFQNVTTHVAPAAPVPAAPPAPVATSVPPPPAESPDKIAPPASSAQSADTTDSTSTADLLKPRLTAPTIGSAERLVPLEIDMHAGGKLVMEGQPVASLDDLKSRLTSVAQAIPHQPVVIRKDRKVTHADLKKVLAICHDLQLKATSLPSLPSAPTPAPAPASSGSAADDALPSPAPILHPSMQLSTGDPSTTPVAKPPPTPGP